jgi:hypothetical protein
MNITEEERFINTLAADVQVLRTVLMALLLSLSKSGSPAYAELKNGVLGGIAQLGLDAPWTQDNERVRQLAVQRAQAFFEDVEMAAGIRQTKPDPSAVN